MYKYIVDYKVRISHIRYQDGIHYIYHIILNHKYLGLMKTMQSSNSIVFLLIINTLLQLSTCDNSTASKPEPIVLGT